MVKTLVSSHSIHLKSIEIVMYIIMSNGCKEDVAEKRD